MRGFGENEGLTGLDQAVQMGGEAPVDWRATYKDFFTIRRTMDEGFKQAMNDFCRRGRQKTKKKAVKKFPSKRMYTRAPISRHSVVSVKLQSKSSLKDVIGEVQDKQGHSGEAPIDPDDVQSLLRAIPLCETDRCAEKLADRKTNGDGDSQLLVTSKEPLHPLIESVASVKIPFPSRSHTNRSPITPLALVTSPSLLEHSPHKQVLPSNVYRDDIHWRVFDFTHNQSNTCPVDPSTMDSRFYMCLSLAGCIPNTQTGNEAPQLLSPAYPIRSVRLFIEAPQQLLYTAACAPRRVLVSSADLRVRLFDSRSGREIGCLEGHKGGVNCIAITEGIIVTGSWDCTVAIWDAVDFQVRHVIHAHAESVTQLAVDSNVVISCCRDGGVCVWQRDSWTLVASLVLHTKCVTGLALTNTCTYTASLDGLIGVWENDSWQLVTVLKIESPVTCMAVRGGLCVVGCENGYIRLWSLATFREELSLLNASQELYDKVTTSFGGEKHADAFRERDPYKQLEVFVMAECAKQSPIRSVEVVGSFLFATNRAAVYQWSLATCSLARIMLAHAAPITCLTGDKHKLVSVGEDGRVVLWHTRPKPLDLSEEDPLILFGKVKRIQL